MKKLLLVFGAIGLLGCFLPMALGLSWFDMRHFDAGWTVWLVMAAFAVPTFIGATDEPYDRADIIASAAAFGYLAYKFNYHTFSMLVHASIGGILMAIGMIGGTCCAALALMGREERRR